ncbi:VDP/USO1/YBL047C family vesicular transport factor [Cryptosporidium felis]|nr:VDP/USO1/YBL047C family vesicular transport factor [Cryptosporidium felis]
MVDENKEDSWSGECSCDHTFNLSLPFPSEVPPKPENLKILEEVSNASKGGTIMLETLRHFGYEEADVYIKYDIVRILVLIIKSELGNFRLDEIILSQGDNMGLLLELIRDGITNHTSYLRNSLELLMLLTRASSEVQKIVTYNGSVAQIVHILREETRLLTSENLNTSGFQDSESVLGKFLDIRDFSLSPESNLQILQILQMSVEIIFHVSQSSNCLKFILETGEVEVSESLPATLTELIELCFLNLELSFFGSEMYNVDVLGNSNNQLLNRGNFAYAFIILRILEISSAYLRASDRTETNEFGKMLEIVHVFLASPVVLRLGLLEKTIEFLVASQYQHNESVPEWNSLVLTAGMTPSLWYGFKKIVCDYKPTIDYITENNSSENEQQAREIRELQEKYMGQMENSLLDWLGTVTIPKSFETEKLVPRDRWAFRVLSENPPTMEKFSLERMRMGEGGLSCNFSELCFWFPLTEFRRLNGKSLFSTFTGQILESSEEVQPEKTRLTLIFHYRLFWLLQILQILIANGLGRQGCKVEPPLISDISNTVAQIWKREKNLELELERTLNLDKNQNKSMSKILGSNISPSAPSTTFWSQLLDEIVNLGNLLVIDLTDTADSEYGIRLAEMAGSYGSRQLEDELESKDSRLPFFNSLSTLTQATILLVVCNVKHPDLEIPCQFLEGLRLLDEKLKSLQTESGSSLLSDTISILLFRFGLLKHTNILNLIHKKLRTNTYDILILNQNSHACLLHAIMNYAGNRGIYSKEDLSLKQEPQGFITDECEPSVSKNEYECLNCIYLHEKMLNERRNLVRMVKRKQQEIDVLVGAYLDSQKSLQRLLKRSQDSTGVEFQLGEEACPKDTVNPDDPSSDLNDLLELIGILCKRFPAVKQFVENHIALSSKVKTEVFLSSGSDEGIQNLEFELLRDSGEVSVRSLEPEDCDDSLVFVNLETESSTL